MPKCTRTMIFAAVFTALVLLGTCNDPITDLYNKAKSGAGSGLTGLLTDEQIIRNAVIAAAKLPGTPKPVSITGIKLLTGTLDPGTAPGPEALMNALYDEIHRRAAAGDDFDLDLSGCSGITDWNNNDYGMSGNAALGKARVTGLTLPDSVTAISGGFTGPAYDVSTSLWQPVLGTGYYQDPGFPGVGARITAQDNSVIRRIEGLNVTDIGTLGTWTDGAGDIVPGVGFAVNANLESVDFPKLQSIPEGAFAGCTGLVSMNLPQVTDIGYQAFAYCTSLISVSFTKLATLTGRGQFSYCTGLSAVSFPNFSSAISKSAFYKCSSLESVHIPKASSLGIGSFYDCINLQSVVAPKVTKIDENAFQECAALRSLYFPELSSIESPTFLGCSSIDSLYLGPTAPTITGYILLGGNYPAADSILVYVPAGFTCPGYASPAAWLTEVNQYYFANSLNETAEFQIYTP